MVRHYFLDILYIWLPALFALLSVVGSALVSWRQRSFAQVSMTVVVFGCVYWSLFTLYRIFGLGEDQSIVLMGWEHLNRIPHVVILIAFGLFAGQAFWFFAHRQKSG